ncbi:hypothetical protein [Cupriavidus sp. CuC1]|uniref:hypothetical protein n=1 Tax=Cupriavidus sp. CuC1 TaxID=3373131 RepID=UPI0037D20A26
MDNTLSSANGNLQALDELPCKSISRSVPLQNEIKVVPTWQYAAIAFLGVLLFNGIARKALNIGGVELSVAVAFLVSSIVSLWFARRHRRLMTSNERRRFLLLYGGSIAATLLLPPAIASLAHPPSIWDLLIRLVNWIPYPASAYLYLSSQRLNLLTRE